jgi:PAS domain S-box-containing protein
MAALTESSATAAADEQRARLAAIVDSSDDGIIGKTMAGVITSWNDGAQLIFGYTAAEMIGRSIALLVPPGREAEETDVLERIARGERVKHLDTVRLRKDGSEIHVSITTSPMRDARGVLIGASKVVRDITDRQAVEDELVRAKTAAEASNRELEAFSYSVAHDLRAPLRGMTSFATLLHETYGDKLDGEGADWLDEIVTNARKMGALIDALLSLARVTRREPHHEAVDLTALVLAAVGRLAEEDPHRVYELVAPDRLTADLDPALARALIDNLVGNAWKFTGNVARARIEFGVGREHGARTFFMRDNGAGFDMTYAGKLFGLFQRLHPIAEFPGTGIGLATVQRIVHRHGGRVSAEGVVDGGATFYFSIPSRNQGVIR